MNHKLQALKYIVVDYLSAFTTWVLFYIFRKIYIEPLYLGYVPPLKPDGNFFLGLIIIPPFWILLYYLMGYYRDVYRKSRLNDIGQTFLQTLIGATVLFFLTVLNDLTVSYKNYYLMYSALIGIHFTLSLIPRYILTSITAKKVHNRIIGFNTIIIGSMHLALSVYNELEKQVIPVGNKIIGYLPVNGAEKTPISTLIPKLGSIKDIQSVVKENKVEEVIIAIEPSEHEKLSQVLNSLSACDVIIKTVPSMYDMLTGKVKMTQIFGTPLIQLSQDLMPVWQANVKQVLDIVISLISLILLSPFILFLAIGVKLSSPGPVFYSHERIGRYGKPFRIFKLRSMYAGSEKNGPELSSKDDTRLTGFGRFMRKYRFDEIPNFLNVLKGEMSLVGPRPERKFYIDQIIKEAPHYVHLQKVKPGITSWGQVKYGYAENIEQMIKRLRYDILYIENMSLIVDFKILFYTVMTILRGKGI